MLARIGEEWTPAPADLRRAPRLGRERAHPRGNTRSAARGAAAAVAAAAVDSKGHSLPALMAALALREGERLARAPPGRRAAREWLLPSASASAVEPRCSHGHPARRTAPAPPAPPNGCGSGSPALVGAPGVDPRAPRFGRVPLGRAARLYPRGRRRAGASRQRRYPRPARRPAKERDGHDTRKRCLTDRPLRGHVHRPERFSTAEEWDPGTRQRRAARQTRVRWRGSRFAGPSSSAASPGRLGLRYGDRPPPPQGGACGAAERAGGPPRELFSSCHQAARGLASDGPCPEGPAAAVADPLLGHAVQAPRGRRSRACGRARRLRRRPTQAVTVGFSRGGRSGPARMHHEQPAPLWPLATAIIGRVPSSYSRRKLFSSNRRR